MALVTAESASVSLEEETYSLLAAPAATSKLVQEARRSLDTSLDLKSLVTDLAQVGGFIRIAYNAVAAAGPDPRITELQIQIQRLGYDITGLCSESVVTITNFKSATDTVLAELKAAYQYLLDGFDNMAINSVAEISSLAEKMSKAANNLQELFKKEEEKVMAHWGP